MDGDWDDEDLNDFLDSGGEDTLESEMHSPPSQSDRTDFAQQVHTEVQGVRERWNARSNVGAASVEGMLDLPSNFLAPAVSDPDMWMFEVQASDCSLVVYISLTSKQKGREEDVVVLLGEKVQEWETTGQPAAMPVFSVMAVRSIPGHVYCEASSPTDVKKVIARVPTHLIVRSEPIFIPMTDRIAILTLPKEVPLERGCWVRIKYGRYKDDIACFEKVDEADSDKLVVWVVPRVVLKRDCRGKTASSRPAAVRFDINLATASFGTNAVKPGPDGAVYFKRRLFKDGLVMLVASRDLFDTNVSELTTDHLRCFLDATAWLKPKAARFLDRSWLSTTLSAV